MITDHSFQNGAENPKILSLVLDELDLLSDPDTANGKHIGFFPVIAFYLA